MPIQSREQIVKFPPQTGYLERNTNRLNTILGLNRISDLKGWHKKVEIDGLGLIDLSCSSTRIVPHGLDADILFGIQTAFELQGRPGSGIIHLTMSQLCSLCCLDDGGPNRKRVMEGLERLTYVKYHAEACWGQEKNGKWRFWSHTFGLIEGVSVRDLKQEKTSRGKDFTADAILEIALSRFLTPSMLSGHLRSFSYTTSNALSQPLSRLMYRILEEQKMQTGRDSYRVPLIAWGKHLGMIQIDEAASQPPSAHDPEIPPTKVLSADRVRRALEPAHKDLMKVGYLLHVEYHGRGSTSEVTYTFSNLEFKPVDPDLLKQFADYGIAPAAAEEQIRAKGDEATRQALATLKARLAGGYRPRSVSGLLMDILKRPENYISPEPSDAHSAQTRETTHSTVQVEVELPEPPRLEKTALIALGKGFDSTPQRRALRDQAVQAFMEGHITLVDLMQFNSLTDSEIAARLKHE